MIESMHVQGSPFDIDVSAETFSDSSDTTLLLDVDCTHQYITGDYISVTFEA